MLLFKSLTNSEFVIVHLQQTQYIYSLVFSGDKRRWETVKIFPFWEESDSWPTASGKLVNCARSQKNNMKKEARISRRGGGGREGLQGQLRSKGLKSMSKRKNKPQQSQQVRIKCRRHKLTCKANSSSVGPLNSNHIHPLTPAAGLSQVQTVVVGFLSKLSREGFEKLPWFLMVLLCVQQFVALRLRPATLRTDCIQRTRSAAAAAVKPRPFSLRTACDASRCCRDSGSRDTQVHR